MRFVSFWSSVRALSPGATAWLQLALATAALLSSPAASRAQTLPDVVSSPNVPYNVRYDDDNPYVPPAGMCATAPPAGSDLDYFPQALAQQIAAGLDNANAPAPGNPNGHHPGLVALGFRAPVFEGASANEVFVYDCNAFSGCDTASAPGPRINFLAPCFVNQSEACLRLVAGHELFHNVQFAYHGRDNWGGWGGMPGEGSARMMQDKVYSDLDANAGCITFAGEAANPLGNPNFTLWDWGTRYWTSLFWNYLTEQVGTSTAAPGIGVDFLTAYYDNVAERPDEPDAIGVLRDTIAEFDNQDSLEKLFRDYAVANAIRNLDLTLVPDALRYRYADENDGNGIAFPDVTYAWSGNVPPQQGPVAGSVVRWGSRHYRANLAPPPGANPCFGVAGFLADGDVASWNLVAVKPGDQVERIFRGVTGRFAKAVLQRRTDPYAQLIAVAAGRDDAASYDYTFACGPAAIDIREPDATRQAFVGNFDAPERFLIRLLVTGPAALGIPSVEGLAPTDFEVFVGPTSDPANQATVLSAARVQGEYWLVAQAPPKPANGTFDLTVRMPDVASASEANAVRYELRILDQVLVIDRSGSMLSPEDSPKLDAAKNAATLFVDAAGSQDRIGAVSFGGDNSEPNDDATLIQLLGNVNDAQRIATKNAINAIGTAPTVLTSIGDGLDKGRQEFVIRGSALGEDWLVLLSDGMENEALRWNNVRAAIQGAGIKVNAIALGPLTDQVLLQRIASETGGLYYYVDVGTAAAAASAAPGARAAAPATGPLANRLGDAYLLAAETIDRHERLWEQAGVAASPQDFPIEVAEGGIEDARFSFNWSSGLVGVEIRRPDGTLVADGVLGARIFSTPTHLVFQVGNLTPGSWTVTVRSLAGSPEYLGLLSGRNRQGATLDLRFGQYHPDDTAKAQGAIFLHGLPMPILATLSDRNGPVPDANVEATIQHPDGRLIVLPLFDDGGHGDGDAGDGLYGNLYTRTTAFAVGGLPDAPGSEERGSYLVRVDATGVDSVDQPFERIRKGGFGISEPRRQCPTFPCPFPDQDADTMPDRYEALHACLDATVNDGDEDPDQDGLASVEEWREGFDPCHPDTDRGGESDASESARGANVFDPRDDALPAPQDVEVVDYQPEHGPPNDLRPNANLIRYPVNAAYAQMRLLRSASPNGPFVPVANFPAVANRGLFYDQPLANGVPVYYRLVALDLNGRASAPSPVFGGTPVADPTPPVANVAINGNEAVATSLAATLSLSADPDVVAMRIDDVPDVSGAPWQAFQGSLPWTLVPDPSTGRASVFAQFRDGSGNESSTFTDEIAVDPGAVLGSIEGTVDLGALVSVLGTVVTVIDGFSSAPPAYPDAAGGFVLAGLPPGVYDLLVSRPGFEPKRIDDIGVAGGGPVDLGTVALAPVDTDGDGILDLLDTCTGAANPTQLDADLDGYGNACDADFDGNGVVGLSDFNRLRSGFGRRCGDTGFDPALDVNGDCVVGLPDFNGVRSGFGRPPGPSGLACAGTPPCSATP